MQFSRFPKDVKRLIANFLSDIDILNYCIVNSSDVCNEQFFHNVLLQRYPDTLKYRNTSFRKWYLSVINYVDLLNREYGFDYRKYGEGSPKDQYKIFKELKDEKDMNKILIVATQKGELALVKFALDNGADIHAKAEIALRWASEDGHLEVVKYLVGHGADIHLYDDYALREASLNGHLETVKYLVEQGAHIHADHDGALRYAIHNGYLEIVKYLVDHGADIHVYSESPLQIASKYGRLEIVKYLVEHGADIHAKNNKALRLAKKYNRWDVVRYLKSLN